MIISTVKLLLMVSMTSCYPQSLDIRRTTNLSSPQEVNNLAHHHPARSTGNYTTSLNSLEKTVEEVEAMLKFNPSLPRLTRGEILDLLENITRADQNYDQFTHRNMSTRERDPKAIMVVLPINAENSDEKTLEDFFTKAPITQIVHSQSFHEAGRFEPSQVDTYSLDTDERNKPTGEKVKKYTSYSKGRPTIFTTIPNFSSTVPTVTKSSNPDHLNENMITEFTKIIHQQTPPTVLSPLTKKRRRPRPTTTHSTEKHPNHRYPEQSDSLTVIAAPKLSPHVINEDLLMDQNNEVLTENESHVSFERVTIREIDLSNDDTITPSILMESDIPEYSNNISANEEVTSAVRVQSNNSDSPKNSSLSEEDEIRHMLASLGVLPPQLSLTTTQEPVNISDIADNLSPDMKELLMSFDLISRPTKNLTSESQVLDQLNPVEPELDSQTYVRFKPLPESDGISGDMRDFLAKFGLDNSVRTDRRVEGIENEVEENLLNLQVVPDEYQGVLEDIGLSDRNGKMMRHQSSSNTSKKQSFKPSDTHFASQEQIEKLNRLIDIVKKLESSKLKITDEDMKKIDIDDLKNLIQSLKSSKVDSTLIPLDQQNVLDPNEFNHGIPKKDVKRQGINESSTDSMFTSTLTPSDMLMTPNMKDLEDSFGANSGSTDETTEPETTTARRKTGFYYLVDWNSFLDIDDQKGKRVNLRFQPTIGDPKQFYSVSVP